MFHCTTPLLNCPVVTFLLCVVAKRHHSTDETLFAQIHERIALNLRHCGFAEVAIVLEAAAKDPSSALTMALVQPMYIAGGPPNGSSDTLFVSSDGSLRGQEDAVALGGGSDANGRVPGKFPPLFVSLLEACSKQASFCHLSCSVRNPRACLCLVTACMVYTLYLRFQLDQASLDDCVKVFYATAKIYDCAVSPF